MYSFLYAGHEKDNLHWNDFQMLCKVIESDINPKVVYDFQLVNLVVYTYAIAPLR